MSLSPPTADSDQVSVILLGATGATGMCLAEHLLENPKVNTVFTFVRRPGALNHLPNSNKLQEIQFGQDDEHTFELVLQNHWPGRPIYAALSCLGTTAKQAGSSDAFVAVDFTMNDQFFTSAHSHGVPHAQLVSSVGADSTSSNLYLKTKGRLEERLKEIGFSSLIYYQPGILDTPGRPTQPSRPGECCALWVMKYCCCCFLGNCFSSWRPMNVYELAHLMNQNLSRPHAQDEHSVTVYKGSQECINAIEEYKQKNERSIE